MTLQASVFRTEETLASMATTLAELRDRAERVSIDDKGRVFNFDLTEALELGYLIDLAEALVVSARARTESRGAHFRDDHTSRDDANWMRHTLAHREPDGTIRLSYKPVDGDLYAPMERKY
jgi:succinate dehydrogenase / fumarate reductase flavoprotein subunit